MIPLNTNTPFCAIWVVEPDRTGVYAAPDVVDVTEIVAVEELSDPTT